MINVVLALTFLSACAVEYEMVTLEKGIQLYRPKGAKVPEKPKHEEPQVLYNEILDIVIVEPAGEQKPEVKT